MKLGIISLGCAKNLVDSELFLGVARRYQMEIVNRLEDADIIVVNTCGFIESAKKESLDTLFEVLDYQKKGKKIIAMGCLIERYLDELKEEIPEIDYFLPIKSYQEIDKLFQEITSSSNSFIFSYPERVLATPPHSAYLKIGEGCNNRCAYCAIPLIRGAYHSRPIEDIMEEVKALGKRKVKEITVIAQDTTRYGSDLPNMSLAKLLKRIVTVEDIELVRVLYLYPDEITDELIEVIKSEPKIAKYFDIPTQHISNDILKAMNRRGNRALIENLIKKIRLEIPNVIIRTTLIVGFPGETEKDFQELKDFIQEIKFERLGVFIYSDEEDTKAYKYQNKVPLKVSQKRYQEIMSIQQRIAFTFNQSRIGQKESVIIDRFDEIRQAYQARSNKEATDGVDGYIYVPSSKPLVLGEYYAVLITKNLGYDLGAILIDNKQKEEKKCTDGI